MRTLRFRWMPLVVALLMSVIASFSLSSCKTKAKEQPVAVEENPEGMLGAMQPPEGMEEEEGGMPGGEVGAPAGGAQGAAATEGQ